MTSTVLRSSFRRQALRIDSPCLSKSRHWRGFHFCSSRRWEERQHVASREQSFLVKMHLNAFDVGVCNIRKSSIVTSNRLMVLVIPPRGLRRRIRPIRSIRWSPRFSSQTHTARPASISCALCCASIPFYRRLATRGQHPSRSRLPLA